MRDVSRRSIVTTVANAGNVYPPSFLLNTLLVHVVILNVCIPKTVTRSPSIAPVTIVQVLSFTYCFRANAMCISASKDTCAEDVLDMICAFRNDTTTEISNTCDRFVEKLSTFTEEISTNPYAVCRGFCQDFIGTCIPTSSHEGLITLTVEQEV